MPPRLGRGAGRAHIGGGAVLEEEVGPSAELVNVGEVRENPKLDRQEEAPGGAG
jgi:hypothetical protein